MYFQRSIKFALIRISRINFLLIMRLVVFLSIAAITQLHAAGYGQTVSLDVSHAPLKKVFREIRKQTGYDFFYAAPLMKQAREVDIHVKNMRLEEVLKKCFADQPFTYLLEEKTVVVKMLPPAAAAVKDVAAITIGGFVHNNKQQPLAAVSVRVKGSNAATATDKDGRFTIRIPDEHAVLIFTCIGFVTKEVVAGTSPQMDISLETDEKGLSEVVVVGYGTQKKSDLTAAVATVDMKSIRNVPQPNLLSTLEGRVAGLTINETSSEPGSEPTVQIRGVGTIDGGSSPLVLIDGVPGGNLSNIASADVESISVLKDAAAAAIYGARAANGVILVTTKKGGDISDKAVLNFNSYVGIQSPTQIPKTLNSEQYATLVNEAASNEGRPAVYTQKDLDLFKNGGDNDMHANTDWLGLILQKNAPIVTNYLSTAGNSKVGRYYIAGEYMYQKGSLQKVDHYRRANLRANITSQLAKNLQLQLLTAYTHSNRDANQGLADIFANALRASPTSPPKFSDGHWGGEMFANDKYLWSTYNPVANINLFGPQSNIKSNTNISVALEYKPLKDLVIKGMGSYMGNTNEQSSYNKSSEAWDFLTKSVSQTGRSSLYQYWYKDAKYDLQLTANYDHSFGQHAFKLLGGYSLESFRNDKINGSRKDFINDELYQLDAGDAASQINGGSADQWSFMSGFGRLNYAFSDRYLLEATVRYDGSSRFAPGKQWGLFPSFSAGWNLEKENFLRNWKPLDQLKLRVSAGQLGNAEKVGLYQWFSGITSGGYYNFDDRQVVGTRLSYPANSNLTWETTTTYNLGLDASFYNGLLEVELDVWKKTTDDILLKVPVSTTIGVPESRITANAGKVGSRGFDLQLTHRSHFSKDLTFTASFSVSSWRSWVIDLKDRASKYSTEFRPGEDLGNIYGYEAVGIINSKEELAAYAKLQGVPPQIGMGDLRYKDQNGDGRIDYMDNVKIGNSYIKLQYGLNLGLQYKGFDLAVFLQGVGNTDRKIGEYIQSSLVNYNSPLAIHLDRWTTENQNADAAFPRTLQNFNQNQSTSSWWVRNGSYIRLKNVQLGYNFSRQFLDRAKISGLRVYVAGANLLTWAPDAVKGFDPERDITNTWYPNFRVISFGVNLKF
jgi:TonB-linked SusC/RagA family outer membrane protein